MNCLEFRRVKLADPRRLSPAAQAHERECAQCARFARSVDDTESEIAQAVHVAVPDGLADRILLRSGPAAAPAWRALALAASVVLGIGLVALSWFGPAPDGAARLAVAHVVDEPQSLTAVYETDAKAVAVAFQSVGAEMTAPLGKVRYLKLCPWEGDTLAWHLVVETPQGLATLLLVADARVHSASDATAEGWNARVQPLRRGFYAVVTSSAAATGEVHRILQARVNWNV